MAIMHGRLPLLKKMIEIFSLNRSNRAGRHGKALEKRSKAIKLKEKLQLTLFTRSEERVAQRSVGGVSQHAMHLRQCICVNIARISTHPVDASLDLPSLCCAQGGQKLLDLKVLRNHFGLASLITFPL
jgi:hypothetical protein